MATKKEKVNIYNLASPEEYAKKPHPFADWLVANGLSELLNDTPYMQQPNVVVNAPMYYQTPTPMVAPVPAQVPTFVPPTAPMYYNTPNYGSNEYVHTPDPRHDFIFNNPNVHSITYKGKQYWLAKDIARELGYDRADLMVKNNVKPGNCITLTSKDLSSNLEGRSFNDLGLPPHTPHATFIDEQGIYDCLDHSRISPKAEEYRNWSNSEVRPSIRKTGAYVDDDLKQQLLSDPTYIQSVIDQNEKLEKENNRLNDVIKANDVYTTLGKACIADGTSVTVNILAKIIQNQLPFNFGEHMLFENLRLDGFLCRDDSVFNNPTARSIQDKLMYMSYDPVEHTYTLMVTSKGVAYFTQFYKNKFGMYDVKP